MLPAVQIRIGGIKGVLCAAPPDSDIAEDEVRIRDSQVKFESEHETINIVKVRQRSPFRTGKGTRTFYSLRRFRARP